MDPATSVLPDPGSEKGQRFRRRLSGDLIAWLTLVPASGTPQPSPVWFLWHPEREDALIYSRNDARRLGWIARNDRAALNLDGSGEGHDFVVLTGTVRPLDPPPPAADANAAFVAKYERLLAEVFGVPQRYAEMFSVPLVFTPRRARGQ